MKRKFFLHRQNEPFDVDHVVYVVWAGESVREQRKLASLMAWAFQKSATLRSWSEDIDYYLMLEEDRVFPGRGLIDFGFVRVDISVSEAVRLAEGDLWASFESSLSQPKHFFAQVVALSPARVDAAARRIEPPMCPSSRRKYLSDSDSSERVVIRFN